MQGLGFGVCGLECRGFQVKDLGGLGSRVRRLWIGVKAFKSTSSGCRVSGSEVY